MTDRARNAQIHATRRARFAHRLAAVPEAAQLDYVKGAMAEAGVRVRGDGRPEFRLRLLGRASSCTSTADGAIHNWIVATLREAARGCARG